MVERVDKREGLKRGLAIEEDDLDRCLIEQPSLFFNVADEAALAIADRDECKLELEELTADLDLRFRAEALATEDKLTETALLRKISLDKKIQTKQREYADKRLAADRWIALKEAFKDRSKMLQELVNSQVSKLYNLGIERGSHGARRHLNDSLAETNHARASQLRAERRKERE